VPKIRTKCC